MKTSKLFLQWITIVTLLAVNTLNTNAQGPFPSSAMPHVVCQSSTEPYGVTLTTGSTYAWTISDPTAGAKTAGATPNLITVNWSKAGNYTLQVVETNQYGCVGSPVTIDVTVNAVAFITNKVHANICSGDNFEIIPVDGAGTDIIPAGTTYSWSAPVVAGITGAAPGSGATKISGTLTNTTDVPVDVVYTVTPTSGSCTGAAFSVTVKVYPQVKTSSIYHN
ncbi:MAG: hypothetical protein AUK44_08740 [Porphyromonadaceae bacterium CG2_30_38_12]|nr:MAG: hypothetical protein AUK44_08740 [Porphyromonadaceae bacterium CG2_30_38_12]